MFIRNFTICKIDYWLIYTKYLDVFTVYVLNLHKYLFTILTAYRSNENNMSVYRLQLHITTLRSICRELMHIFVSQLMNLRNCYKFQFFDQLINEEILNLFYHRKILRILFIILESLIPILEWSFLIYTVCKKNYSDTFIIFTVVSLFSIKLFRIICHSIEKTSLYMLIYREESKKTLGSCRKPLHTRSILGS